MPADWICFWMAPRAGERLYADNQRNISILKFREKVQSA
jgi:hypothetical protein